MRIGRITISDRAAAGVYPDLGGPEIESVLKELLPGPLEFIDAIIPDDRARIEQLLVEFADRKHCALVATTGGTGPAIRDVTPEATRAVIEKELPGFGEIMRINAWPDVRTSILSRAVAGVRGRCLIVNLPGKPKAIGECLGWLAPAIIEAVQLLQGVDPHRQG